MWNKKPSWKNAKASQRPCKASSVDPFLWSCFKKILTTVCFLWKLTSDKLADAPSVPVRGVNGLSQRSIIWKPPYRCHGKHLEFIITVSRLRKKWSTVTLKKFEVLESLWKWQTTMFWLVPKTKHNSSPPIFSYIRARIAETKCHALTGR